MGSAPDAMNCLAPMIAKVRKPHKEEAAHPRLSRAAPVLALGCTARCARGTPSTGQECPVHVRNTLYTTGTPCTHTRDQMEGTPSPSLGWAPSWCVHEATPARCTGTLRMQVPIPRQETQRSPAKVSLGYRFWGFLTEISTELN